MQAENRELLQEESGVESEQGEHVRAGRGVRSPKRWLALAAASALVAFAGTAAILHKTRAPPLTKRSAKPVMLEEAEACATRFDFTHDVHNNLGNKGPSSGAEGMEVAGVYTHPGDPDHNLEMHFHTYNAADYCIDSRDAINRLRAFNTPPDYMAMIRVAPSSEAKIRVEIVDPATGQEHVLDYLAFTFFDIDGSHPACESVYVENANEFVMAQGTAVDVDTARANEGFLKFESTVGPAELPEAINAFETESQREHSIQFVFRRVSHFNITLHTEDCGMRVFAFVGRASIQCAESADGSIPLVDIETAAPVPAPVDEGTEYCVWCWIHPALAIMRFGCTLEPEWWTTEC